MNITRTVQTFSKLSIGSSVRSASTFKRSISYANTISKSRDDTLVKVLKQQLKEIEQVRKRIVRSRINLYVGWNLQEGTYYCFSSIFSNQGYREFQTKRCFELLVTILSNENTNLMKC